MKNFINPAKAASDAEVTTGRIYQILQSGDLPFTRCLGRIRILESDWQAFLQAKNDTGRVLTKQPDHKSGRYEKEA